MSNSDLINKYLKGEMDAQERTAFENEMKNNSELAEEVKLHREIDETLKDTDVLEFHQQLDAIYKKLNEEGQLSSRPIEKKSKQRIIHLRWYYAAASFVILLGISAVLYLILRPPLNERLYAMYFKPYDGTINVRSGNQRAVSEMQSALDAYNNEDFKTAWAMLKDISDKDKTNAKAYFFRGMSAMEINEPDDAIASFNNVIKHETSLYIDQAIWYQALCYLKKDDNVDALIQLTKVVETNGNHKPEAEEIIGKLKK
jgi:hypothetical protein